MGPLTPPIDRTQHRTANENESGQQMDNSQLSSTEDKPKEDK